MAACPVNRAHPRLLKFIDVLLQYELFESSPVDTRRFFRNDAYNFSARQNKNIGLLIRKEILLHEGRDFML
jgi:hypothetical protein